MSLLGWLFLTIAWGFILSLAIYSISKVLKNNSIEKK